MDTTTIPSARAGRMLDTWPHLTVWIAWHVISAICIPLVASQERFEASLRELAWPQVSFLATLSVVHLAIAAILTWRGRRRPEIQLHEVLAVVLVVYAVTYLALRQTGAFQSRSILMIAAFGSAVLASISLDLRPRLYKVLLPALACVTAGLIALGWSGGFADADVEWSAFYRLRLDVHAGLAPSEVRDSGALSVFGNGLLVAAGDGGLFYLETDPSTTRLTARRLPYEVPLNRRTLLAGGPVSKFGNELYRVTDILVQRVDDERFRLFAAHNYWKPAEGCTGLAVSMIEGSRSAFLGAKAGSTWETIYETKPCLPIERVGFLMTGGRLIEMDQDTLLLSTGDHGITGWNGQTWKAEDDLAQDPNTDYGKTLLIDVKTGASKVHSLGHRNPQGLHRAADGRIWLTEHAMMAGDELNAIVAGANYGWPYVTLGTDYDYTVWPVHTRPGRHDGYASPANAWLPSIGISAVTSVQSDRLASWKGDLLVASLKEQTLFRVRPLGDRVVFVERAFEDVGAPIRDLTETPDGRIALLLEGGSIAFIEAVGGPPIAGTPMELGSPAAAAGAMAFKRCQDCHPVASGTNHGAGPDLAGIVGRPIASARGYEYSAALRTLSGTWTEQRLDDFLKDPDAFAPGTSMTTEAIADEETRRNLIEFLRSSSTN